MNKPPSPSLTFMSAGFAAACFVITLSQMPEARSETRILAAEAQNPAARTLNTPKKPFDARSMPYPGSGMLAYDDFTNVTVVARRVEAMLRAAEAPVEAVCPHGLRDPDGTLGMFIVAGEPFVTPDHSQGMDDRKAWIILAAIAAVKYGTDCPTKIDYIGLTDPRGMEERWYYRLNFKTAQKVQRKLCTSRMPLEKGLHRTHP